MYKLICITIFLSLPICLAAAQLGEKWQKRIADAESNYATAISKAETTRFYAVQKANGDRLAVLKKALADATKAGDFDAATSIKENVVLAEKAGAGRPKPKNVFRFGKNEYAFVDEKVSWYLAERRCEEMGGHLAVIDTREEQAFVLDLCSKAAKTAWLGASNEEGKWSWVTGPQVKSMNDWTINEGASFAVGLTYWAETGAIDDFTIAGRFAYVCEWD